MTTVEVFAPAKINLSLHITGRRDDGYHLLDSLVVFATDEGDWITVSPSDTLELSVSGPLQEGVPTDHSNLVLKAAKRLQALRNVLAGARISLEKHLPNGGGIGGGSSDAAAALKALAQLWNVPTLTGEEALTLGADLPVCLNAPKASFVEGIGEIVTDAPLLPDFWLVLANPGVIVPTSDVFQRLEKHFSTNNPPMEPLELGSRVDFELSLCAMRNDLTMCMYDFQMEVLEVVWALREMPTCVKSNMSGSGSTCWGLFDSKREALDAARKLETDHPDWWVRTTGVS